MNLSVMGVVSLIDADLVASDPYTDVAILKARQTPDQVQLTPLVTGDVPPSITPQTPVSPKGATLKSGFPRPGETLLLAGFPLGQDALVVQTGVATGFYSNPRSLNGPPPSALRIMLSLVSNPGNSGGPVLDADGKVVGLLEGNLFSPIRDERGRQVLSPRVKLDDGGNPVLDAHGDPQFEIAPLTQNSGISFAVPAKFIADLAKKNNINLD